MQFTIMVFSCKNIIIVNFVIFFVLCGKIVIFGFFLENKFFYIFFIILVIFIILYLVYLSSFIYF
jgi:hypothetical protein